MSVEYCLLRVAPPQVEELRQQPGLLAEWMDAFYAQSAHEKVYVDSREVIRGAGTAASASLRMLYFEEFTTSLLVNFMEEGSAFFAALAGWGKAHILEGVNYGYGEISYYLPEEITNVAAGLDVYPEAFLEARFHEQAVNFRIAAAGYFANDQAILAHQYAFANLLRQFYHEAAQERNFVLLLIV